MNPRKINKGLQLKIAAAVVVALPVATIRSRYSGSRLFSRWAWH